MGIVGNILHGNNYYLLGIYWEQLIFKNYDISAIHLYCKKILIKAYTFQLEITTKTYMLACNPFCLVKSEHTVQSQSLPLALYTAF